MCEAHAHATQHDSGITALYIVTLDVTPPSHGHQTGAICMATCERLKSANILPLGSARVCGGAEFMPGCAWPVPEVLGGEV
jgi:hypothetical protein